MVKKISSGSDFEKEFSYSRAIKDKDMIYISGTTGYDYVEMVLPKSVEIQARNAIFTIKKTLEQFDSSLNDVVRVRYYIKNRQDIEKIAPIINQAFYHARPAATMIITDLIEEEMKIEIEVSARIGAYNS